MEQAVDKFGTVFIPFQGEVKAGETGKKREKETLQIPGRYRSGTAECSLDDTSQLSKCAKNKWNGSLELIWQPKVNINNTEDQ